MDYLSKIKRYIDALTPLFYVGTYSSEVVKEELKEMAATLTMEFHCVSLNDISSSGEDPLQSLDNIVKRNKKNMLGKRSLFVLYFYHLLLKDADPLIIAKLRQIADTHVLNSTVIILGIPHFTLPPELSDVSRINHTTVTRKEILELIEAGGEDYTEEEIEELTSALAGVKSRNEVETLLALSMVTKANGRFDSQFIMQEKKALILSRSKGLFEILEPQFGLEFIGGLDALVEWTHQRIPLFKKVDLEHPNLSKPRGILLMGIPGGGKSFFATAIGKTFGIPVVKLDPYKLFQSSLGETETNFLHVLESLRLFHTPTILFIDEIEKSFSLTDGSTDGNTSNRILSVLLDFLSNHHYPIFTVATCNSIGSLPPELLRKGRFDEIFYIPFPDQEERSSICKALCNKYDLNISITDLLVSRLKDFTGSEIEQVFKNALYESLGRNRGKNISEFTIIQQAVKMVPLRTMMEDELNILERWALKKCRWASSRKTASNKHYHDAV